jgi:hypothetical protein
MSDLFFYSHCLISYFLTIERIKNYFFDTMARLVLRFNDHSYIDYVSVSRALFSEKDTHISSINHYMV